jgi:carbon monoxide dehydrogenase subunit G
MADQTTSSIAIAAPPAAILAVIADFSSYPAWATGVQKTEVVAIGNDGRAQRVHFVLDASPIKDEYTLEYRWDGDRQVSWHLVEGRVLKAMQGAYELSSDDGHTTVTYRLSVDVAMPLIGMLKRKAEKVITDAALKNLKLRVETAADRGGTPWD